jgi:hypothetical protein
MRGGDHLLEIVEEERKNLIIFIMTTLLLVIATLLPSLSHWRTKGVDGIDHIKHTLLHIQTVLLILQLNAYVLYSLDSLLSEPMEIVGEIKSFYL